MVTRVLRWGTGLGCFYEAVAIFSRGHLPTISEWVGDHRVAGAVVGGIAVGGLAAHFLLGEQED